MMNSKTGKPYNGIGADFAFAIVVLMAYFVTFSSISTTTQVNILILIGLGITYITLGIYFFSYCTLSGNLIISLSYFLTQIIIGGLIIFFGKGASLNLLILLPLAGHSVILLRGGWVYIVNGLILGTYSITLFSFSRSWEYVSTNTPIFLAGQVFIVAFLQMAVSEERARKEIEKLVGNLRDANRKLKDYADQIELLTITQERSRLAREIHDGLGHYLATINMQLQAASAVIMSDKAAAIKTLLNAQTLVKDALAEVRRSVYELREENKYTNSLIEKIQRISEDSNNYGVETKFSIDGLPRHLQPAVELALFRASQEGINNVYKHADATEIWIFLDYTNEDQVGLIIRDNGKGKDSLGYGFGLMGLRERLELLNGKVNFESKPGEGFVLSIVVPG